MNEVGFHHKVGGFFFIENPNKKMELTKPIYFYPYYYILHFIHNILPVKEKEKSFDAVLYQQIREKSTSKSKFPKERLSCFAFFRKVCNIHK